MKRTGVSKTVFLLFAHKQHNLVMPLRLLGVNPSSAIVMRIGILGLPMEVVFIDDIIIVLRRRRKVFVGLVQGDEEQGGIVLRQIKYT